MHIKVCSHNSHIEVINLELYFVMTTMECMHGDLLLSYNVKSMSLGICHRVIVTCDMCSDRARQHHLTTNRYVFSSLTLR